MNAPLPSHATSDPHPPIRAGTDSPRIDSKVRYFIYAVIIASAAGISLAAICNVRPLLSANDRSRWCTVWSLVERGTYRIDEITEHRGWDTIDKVLHEGHFYSSKPALLPTLVAGVYWAVKQTTGWTLLRDTEQATRAILIVVNLLPMIAAWVLLAAAVERYARTNSSRLFVVGAACFATFLTTYLVTLNNHTVAAASLVFALYPAMRILAGGSGRPGHFALCGFFAAFTCTNELPAALFGLLLFLLLLREAPRRTLFWFLPAALVPLAAYFATNYLQSGGWKPFYFFLGTEKYEYEIGGVPSYWLHPKGLDRNVDSPLVYFLHCTVGHHGILSLTPIYVLTILSWLQMPRWRQFPLRVFLWMGMLLTAVVFGFYLSRTQNYNYGGSTAGLRWLFWLIPLWLIGLIPVLETWGPRRWFQSMALVMLLLSVFSAWYPIDNPWQHPWLFNLMEQRGWIDYSTPPPELKPPPTTWMRSLPAGPTPNKQVWIELAGANVDGTTSRLRLEDAGWADTDVRSARRIVARWNPGSEQETAMSFAVDVRSFNSGAPPSRFLRWPQGVPSREEQLEARFFLRGLPRPQTYRGRAVHYLKTPLSADALRCIHATAQVDYRPDHAQRELRYRVDVWYCDDVPFGVARVITSTSDPSSGALLARRRLTVVAAGRRKATIESNSQAGPSAADPLQE